MSYLAGVPVVIILVVLGLVFEVRVVLGFSGGPATEPIKDGKENALPLNGVIGPLRSSLGLLNLRSSLSADKDFSKPIRSKRTATEHHITDCIHMTSEEGEFYHKALSADGHACGIYIFGEPDQNIEIRFSYLDVPCDNGGLVSVVDGWELKGEFFPSTRDHPKPLRARFNEFCGERKIKKVFVSSQNVALIQYRMPARGTSFSFTVRFIKNPTPCNVFFQSDELEPLYTLRNYGKRVNCSLSTLFPAAVSTVALDVGVTSSIERGIQLETGTIHKCQKRGLDDYVEIGGSLGLDNRYLQVADSICGLNSKPGKYSETILCETTTVRMVSSGSFDNSVTVHMRQITENDIDGHLSVVCLPEDISEK